MKEALNFNLVNVLIYISDDVMFNYNYNFNRKIEMVTSGIICLPNVCSCSWEIV